LQLLLTRQGVDLQKLKCTTLADCIAQFIAEKNTPAVFQLSGGMIAFIIDAIGRLGKTQIINTRHEQAAGFAAEGSARISRIPGFAMGTSGPGATNLLTPIASSYFDSIPVVYITGQVNQKELRTNLNQRQNGFQELDICEMAKSITKKVYKPESAAEVLVALNEGWILCQEGRQGPVLIDIPINLQQDFVKYELSSVSARSIKSKISASEISEFSDLLSSSKRPLLLIGGGVRLSNATELLSRFISKSGIPYVSTLLGLDSISHVNENYLGFIGSYGNRWANSAVKQSDLLIVIGSRLDVRQTGKDISKFKSGKKIIRIDIDEHELSGRISSDLSIKLDASEFLQAAMEIDYKIDSSSYISRIQELKKKNPQELEQPSNLILNPNIVMEYLGELFYESSGFIIDVGQHQMWAAQSIQLKDGQRFLTSGGLGAMGFAIPASIGAATAGNGRWVAISGDGCLQLSSAELQTIVQYNLPIAICVINNGQHGMVAQFQEENMDGRLTGTRDGFSNPDFQELAKAYGFNKISKITRVEDLMSLKQLVNDGKNEPIFLEFVVDPRAKALPKMSVRGEEAT
jgi:acetolactate synthase-1/2/3 large subunit